jgi:hypothetical protein
MVGPPGSTRDGAFSWGAGPDEDELCGEFDDWDCAEARRLMLKQTTPSTRKADLNLQNGMKKTLSESLVKVKELFQFRASGRRLGDAHGLILPPGLKRLLPTRPEVDALRIQSLEVLPVDA